MVTPLPTPAQAAVAGTPWRWSFSFGPGGTTWEPREALWLVSQQTGGQKSAHKVVSVKESTRRPGSLKNHFWLSSQQSHNAFFLQNDKHHVGLKPILALLPALLDALRLNISASLSAPAFRKAAISPPFWGQSWWPWNEDYAGQCASLGWEFIKEKKKVRKQENTHASTQTCTRPRKKELVQENTHSYTKASTQKRTWARKHTHVQANPHSCLRVCFLARVLFFAWTLSCMSACLRVWERVFLVKFFFCVDACVFAWMRACLLSCSLSFFLLLIPSPGEKTWLKCRCLAGSWFAQQKQGQLVQVSITR